MILTRRTGSATIAGIRHRPLLDRPHFAPERLQATRSAAGALGWMMARKPSVASVSAHASRRLAQRNLSTADVLYVYTHGRLHHNGKATFIHLGLRDIPSEDLRDDRRRRLEGTVLVLDPTTGCHLTTAYRNRQRGSRDIRRKLKRSIPTPSPLLKSALDDAFAGD